MRISVFKVVFIDLVKIFTNILCNNIKRNIQDWRKSKNRKIL